MIILYYFDTKNTDNNIVIRYTDILNFYDKKKLYEFKYSKDKKLLISSRLLLNQLLIEFGLKEYNSLGIKYTDYGKPYLPDIKIDFNISHSQNIAACGISNVSKIGIDIEAVQIIDIEDFKEVLTDNEYFCIKHHKDPDTLFYKVWTAKEAIMKAEGKGFYMSAKSFEVLVHNEIRDVIHIEDRCWYLYQSQIYSGQNYIFSIALSQREAIRIHKINL